MPRAIVVKRFGGPEVLQLEQVAVPEPKPGEARGRIVAAGDANQGIFAFNVATLRDQPPNWYQADLTALFEQLERGRIAPPVADRLELAQVAEAHRRLERADVVGKLVVLPGANARL